MSEIEKTSKVEAHRRAELIRMGMVTYAQTLETIAEAFAARDWVTLGYESWDVYVDKEFAEKRLKLDSSRRREAAEALRLTGMSPRAIGSALGVGEGTVRRDLAGAPNGAPEATVGADGKQYAPTRPDPEPPTDPLPPAIAEQIEERIAEKTAPREDQPVRVPAEATDASTDPHTVRSAAAVGADPTPAPTATNPVEEFIKNDPVIQAHDYAVAFAKALSKSGVLLDFDSDKIGKTISDESFFALQVHVDCLNRFFEKTRKARFGGPRLVKGDTA